MRAYLSNNVPYLSLEAHRISHRSLYLGESFPSFRVSPPEARHCDGHRAATAGGTATRQRQRGATKRRVGEGLPGGSTYEVEKDRYLWGVLCFLRYIMCMIV